MLQASIAKNLSNPTALEKVPAAANRMACSVSQVYREIKAGRLGPLVKVGARSSALPSSSTDAWIAARIAERNHAENHQQERRCRMNTRTALLNRWRKVLVSTLGEDGLWNFDQIPDMEQFPPRFPIAAEFDGDQNGDEAQRIAASMLSGVLCLAALKLHRADGNLEWLKAGDLSCYLDRIVHRLHTISPTLPYGSDFSSGYLLNLGAALELAMLAPDRWPVFLARLDAIGNEDLRRMAIAAVQGLGDESILLDMVVAAVSE